MQYYFVSLLANSADPDEMQCSVTFISSGSLRGS